MQKGKNLKIRGSIIIGILIISLVIPTVPICNLSVSARCNPITHIQPRTIITSPGESFCLSVIVNSCYIETKGIGFKMTYPSPTFIFQNLTYHNLLGTNVWHKGGDNGAGLIDYTLGRGMGNPLTIVNGSFATIYFTVSSTAPLGIYQIWFESHIYDMRDSYNNNTPRHCANINVIASGDTSGGDSGDTSSDNPKIDVQPRTFPAGQPICINVNLDSYDVPVRTVGLRLWYPPSFEFLERTYMDLLGAPSQVLQVGGDNGAGFFNYAVTRLLQTGNSPVPINGNFITLCFEPVPGGIYTVCFECEIYDPSNELIPSLGYQCVNVTVEENVTGEENVTVEENVTGEQPPCCNCIYGDANCDCRIDIFDLDALTQAWGSCRDCGDSQYRECVDCDNDGIIGIIDLDYLTHHWGISYCDCEKCDAPWSECDTYPAEPETCYCHKGDCDCDGDVDAADSAVFKGALGSCYPDPGYKECCDFDDDGCIGLVDDYWMDQVAGTRYCDCNDCTPPWEPWP